MTVAVYSIPARNVQQPQTCICVGAVDRAPRGNGAVARVYVCLCRLGFFFYLACSVKGLPRTAGFVSSNESSRRNIEKKKRKTDEEKLR